MVASELKLKGAEAVEFDPTKAKLISKRRRITLPQWATAWIVLLPALVFICMFMLYPIINTFLYAFMQNFNTAANAGNFALGQFVAAIQFDPILEVTPSANGAFGFDNFRLALTDPNFLASIGNTAILTIVEVPLTIIIALLIATFLNSIKVLRGFFQTIFFLPYVTNTIALGLVFNIAFSSTQGGLVNMLLMNVFGVKEPIEWLTYNASKFSQGVVIVLYAIWNGLAFKILVFMAGLATIDKQYSDAAKIDGANHFTIWRRITLPLLSPQILYITITSFIGSFKMYTGVMAVYQQSSGGQGYYFGGHDEWIPVVGWIYKNLDISRPGRASAASLILLAIIMVITAVQFMVSKKRVHY